MPGKTQTHTDAVLNVLRGTNIAGVTPYVGLLSVAPANDADSGTELSGNGYERQPVAFGVPETDTGNVRRIRNSAVITFGPATADWPQAVAFGIYSAATGGTLLYWDYLTAPKTVQSGDSAQFAVNALVVRED